MLHADLVACEDYRAGLESAATGRGNLIERCVNALKQSARIATRYEKTARAFLSMLGAARLWIKTALNTASAASGVEAGRAWQGNARTRVAAKTY